MKLSKNFLLSEFTKSGAALRHNIDNNAPDDVIDNIKKLVDNILQPLRDKLGASISISSGYRSGALNLVLGGAPVSDHLYGKAADIEMNKISNMCLASAIINMNVPFRQLILEYPDVNDPRAGWVHISFDENDNKGEVLTALKVNGKTKYVRGLTYCDRR